MTTPPPSDDLSDRFAFGANWARFLRVVDESRIAAAVASLQQMLGLERLDGMTFLDVGSGSGLFSLAAHRLGARVHSFDYDPKSVACTQELQRRYGSDEPSWTIEQGSALDTEFLSKLAPADIVYSWGVLHHTGDLWTAVERVAGRVSPAGVFFLAVYNDQGRTTDQWMCVKRMYQALPQFLRPLLVAACGMAILTHRLWQLFVTIVLRLLACQNPLKPARELARSARRVNPRGMHRWYDLVDWVGGWPFEVARPDEVFSFLSQRGFELVRMQTVGGKMGCNEYVFARRPAQSHRQTPERRTLSGG
ncbi:MAG: class I SAM-dependent methyltransferase [Planctomycetaceae bacterium]|nr:class I SAM-dependent methyltransferase [Planctomycetaceae bacterium]